jgi:hypothetical protein
VAIAKNQPLESKAVSKTCHSLEEERKKNAKMKGYPYGLLKTRELKNDLAQIRLDP